jgi:hypothetical protein
MLPRQRSKSLSASASASASLMRKPALQSTTHERSRPQAMRRCAGDTHHGHDFLDGRRIGGIAQTFVARRSAAAEAGHGRRRPATARGVEQDEIGHAGPVPRPRSRRYLIALPRIVRRGSRPTPRRGYCYASKKQRGFVSPRPRAAQIRP